MTPDERLTKILEALTAHETPTWLSYTGLAAVAISLAAVWVSRQQITNTRQQHVNAEWNALMDTCINHPEFMDIKFTSLYPTSPGQQGIYSAFCYKVWSLVEYIVTRGLARTNPYSAILYWAAALHRDWLDNNPYMFADPAFWRAYNQARNEPLTMFRNPTLPRSSSEPIHSELDRYSDGIDWNAVSKDYHNYIIGPWAPVMLKRDPARGNKTRNLLLNALDQYDANKLRSLRILDFGCGPGTTLESLAGKVTEIHGLDISPTALDIAQKKAKEFGINFVRIQEDMRTYAAPEKYDLILASNSILPRKRSDVLIILERIRDNLADDGKLLAILPSFDTCEYLVSRWQKIYRRRSNDEAYVEKCVEAFKKSKKMDVSDLTYADDGVHSQCFHTPQSIAREFPAAGLQLIGKLQKVLYPWEYARDFDYGFFPGTPEIWDWYVEARRAPASGSSVAAQSITGNGSQKKPGP
jgi:SAM-dependent methyltransferase